MESNHIAKKIKYHDLGVIDMKRLSKLLLLIVLFFIGWTVYIYYNLDIGQSPQVSDVIIVAGGQTYRETKAKELLNQGYSRSNKVIISPISEQGMLSRKEYNELIVNPANIEIEDKATSTWTNATESIKIMEKRGWKSAIVVTSDFHTRRTRLAFERAARGKGISFVYVSAYPQVNGQIQKYLDYQPNQSWALSEIPKYWGYVFGLYDVVDLE